MNRTNRACPTRGLRRAQGDTRGLGDANAPGGDEDQADAKSPPPAPVAPRVAHFAPTAETPAPPSASAVTATTPAVSPAEPPVESLQRGWRHRAVACDAAQDAPQSLVGGWLQRRRLPNRRRGLLPLPARSEHRRHRHVGQHGDRRDQRPAFEAGQPRRHPCQASGRHGPPICPRGDRCIPHGCCPGRTGGSVMCRTADTAGPPGAMVAAYRKLTSGIQRERR